MNRAYNQPMPRPVIHISETEAASDFAAVLARVRAGAEVIIEHDAQPIAVISPAEPLRGSPISESIALAKAHEEETGVVPVLDPDFAADLEEIINHHN
jgi:antitoxin (DNA-binding transcriptional repressor) of toxin-antitoxin stability system